MAEETSNEYFVHTVTNNQRWDQIAYQYYGNAKLYAPIIRANPSIPIHSTLTEGLRLKIPILDLQDIQTDTEGAQPPWR